MSVISLLNKFNHLKRDKKRKETNINTTCTIWINQKSKKKKKLEEFSGESSDIGELNERLDYDQHAIERFENIVLRAFGVYSDLRQSKTFCFPAVN